MFLTLKLFRIKDLQIQNLLNSKESLCLFNIQAKVLINCTDFIDFKFHYLHEYLNRKTWSFNRERNKIPNSFNVVYLPTLPPLIPVIGKQVHSPAALSAMAR